MTNRAKASILTAVALLVSILPPLVATLLQFPVWTERSAEATVSGVVCFLGFVCLVPLYKQILALLKTPSAPILWTVLALLMYVMKSIAAEMFVVAVVGAVSNTVGWALFKWRDVYRRRE